MAHEKWQEAWNCLDLYLDSRKQPLFSDIKFDSANDDFAAFLALMCAKSLDSLSMMMKYSEEAIRYSPRREYTVQLLAEAWKLFTPQKMYLHYLQEGFKFYPQSTYFFPRLMDSYTQRRQLDEALKTVDYALEADSLNQLYLFAKSNVLMQQDKYAESLKYAEKLIAQNDSMAEAYFNAGTAYLNIALNMDPQRHKKQIRKMYQKAMPYMENYRKLAPTEKQK